MRYVFLALAIAALSGCAMERQSTPGAEGPQGIFQTADTGAVTASEYRVAPPDHLRIKAPKIAEIDNTDVEVRSDGIVTLNFVGEVYVAGKTPREIGRELSGMMGKYYLDAPVQCEVSQFKSKKYHIFGNVNNQGSKPFTGNNSVLEALAEAGFTDASWPQQVSVSRPHHLPDQPNDQTAIVDIKHMYLTGDERQNYALKEGDVIYVPKGPLGEFNDTMHRVLDPFTGAVGASHMTGG